MENVVVRCSLEISSKLGNALQEEVLKCVSTERRKNPAPKKRNRVRHEELEDGDARQTCLNAAGFTFLRKKKKEFLC